MGQALLEAAGDTCLGLHDLHMDATAIKANPLCDDLMAEARRYVLSGPSAAAGASG